MFTSHRHLSGIGFAVVVAVLIIFLLSGGGATPAPVAVSDLGNPWDADYPTTYETDRATIRAQTHDQVELAFWGLDVYGDTGLDLPHVEIWMSHDTSGCVHPNSGSKVRGYATWRDGQAVLFHCGDAFTMLHELAHIYDRHALTDEDREAFLQLRGLKLWQDTDKWGRSGEEHFANVLAWGLDVGARREVRTLPNDDVSLAVAFTAIVGIEPELRNGATASAIGGETGVNSAADGGPPPHEAPSLTAAEERSVELAESLYEDVGLRPPQANVRFHRDASGCDGHAGFHRLTADGGSDLDICVPDPHSETADVRRIRILWHEMAHAYIAQTLDKRSKALIVSVLGLESWRDGRWGQRGIEHAAEVLVWGITGGRYRFRAGLAEPPCQLAQTALRVIAAIPVPNCEGLEAG